MKKIILFIVSAALLSNVTAVAPEFRYVCTVCGRIDTYNKPTTVFCDKDRRYMIRKY